MSFGEELIRHMELSKTPEDLLQLWIDRNIDHIKTVCLDEAWKGQGQVEIFCSCILIENVKENVLSERLETLLNGVRIEADISYPSVRLTVSWKPTLHKDLLKRTSVAKENWTFDGDILTEKMVSSTRKWIKKNKDFITSNCCQCADQGRSSFEWEVFEKEFGVPIPSDDILREEMKKVFGDLGIAFCHDYRKKMITVILRWS
jgi:hypothetical protein